MHEGRDAPEDSSESCRNSSTSCTCAMPCARATHVWSSYLPRYSRGSRLRTVLSSLVHRSEANPPPTKEYKEYAKRGSLERRSNWAAGRVNSRLSVPLPNLLPLAPSSADVAKTLRLHPPCETGVHSYPFLSVFFLFLLVLFI